MERIHVESSNVISIGYDEGSLILEVEFNSGIPSYLYEELMASGSKGGYLHQNIKGNYSYEKI